jgi:FMN phosphatase YigB (HAD superfamily)
MRRFDLVSVDVWDTILRRAVHPDEVKLHVARWLQLHHAEELRPEHARDLRALFAARCEAEGALAREAAARGDDDEYTLDEVQRRWLGAVLREPPSDGGAALRGELLAREVAFERRTTSLDPGILAALRPYEGIPLVLASDFYLGADVLEDLVRRAGFHLPLRAIYVSCEHRRSKRSGRLFETIQRDLGVQPARHLHLGDNPTSDVAVPRRLGMTAIYYRHPVADAVRSRNEARFAWREKRVAPVKLVHEAQAKVRIPRDMPGHARACFELGVRHGMPFIAFVHAVIEAALRQKHERIHYFTREGVFFRRIHDALARSAPFPKPVPPSSLLTVSRVSTFAASLGAIAARRPGPLRTTTDDLMGVWRLYSTQSMAAMLTTLGEEPRGYADLLARHAIEPTQPIQYPWQDPRVVALFADAEFQRRIGGALQGRRERIVKYLSAHGLGPGTPRAAVVDIGWRGTIQDNLAELLPATTIEGFYVGLHVLLNPQPPNVRKHGVFCDRNVLAPGVPPEDPAARPRPHLAMELPSVVEMLCNSATGSALDYREGELGFEPVTERHPAEDAVWFQHIRWFQEGVLALVPHLADGLRTHPLEAHELVAEARRELARLLAAPPPALAGAYFELSHNEGFGLGGFVQKRARIPRSVEDLDRSGWPQGLLRHVGLGVMLRWWNDRILHLDGEGAVHR